jgi:DNA-binding NarL/FixJ family response regulator
MVPGASSKSTKGKKTRLLIADDHRVITEGIKQALAKHPEFEIVGVAYDGRQAVHLMESLRPDILIIDLSMPEMNGFEASLRIKETYPDTAILVFSMFRDIRVVKLLKAGIAGYVAKDEPVSELISALNSIRTGRPYFSKEALGALQNHSSEKIEKEKDKLQTLSLREREVFTLLANGLTIKEIAVKLHISAKTVESHKYNIMQKLNVSSITQLTKLAVKKGMIKA